MSNMLHSPDGWRTGDPPCCISNDHYWHGSVCTECGERLRCLCGRFMAAEDMDAHIMRGDCPSVDINDPEYIRELALYGD